jgi:hypothetical protein
MSLPVNDPERNTTVSTMAGVLNFLIEIILRAGGVENHVCGVAAVRLVDETRCWPRWHGQLEGPLWSDELGRSVFPQKLETAVVCASGT